MEFLTSSWKSSSIPLSAIALSGAMIGGLASAGHAGSFFEFFPLGPTASFETPSNWQPSGGPPGLLDEASFAYNETYTVLFSSSPINDHAVVHNGSPTFRPLLSSPGIVHTYVLVDDAMLDGNAALTLTGNGDAELQLDVGGRVTVGYFDHASLNVEPGGWLFSFDSTIADLPASTGNVTVNGAGARWDNFNFILIGNQGNGSLEVLNGGTVESVNAIIATVDGSTGHAIVDGSGSTMQISQQLSIGGGGTVEVQNGGDVSTTDSRIGTGPNTLAQAIIDGAGSTWDASNELVVGNGTQDQGALTIQNGAVMTAGLSSIGFGNTATGHVTVDGDGSMLNSTGNLIVGRFGDGTLVISNDGSASNVIGSIGDVAGSNGSATITGLGSTWNNSDDLYVGNAGQGEMIVEEGGIVSSAVGAIGVGAGTTGNVFVRDIGSIWSVNGNLFVGSNGSATLDIDDEGTVYVGEDAFLALQGAAMVTIGPGGVFLVDDDVHFSVNSAGSSTIAFAIGEGSSGAINAGSMSVAGDLILGEGTAMFDLIVDESVVLSLGDQFTLIDYGAIQSGFEFENLSDDGFLEIGPYEFQFDFNADISGTGDFALVAEVIAVDPSLNPCPADLDDSGDVGFSDLLVLLAAWGSDDAAADLDGDNVVGFSDLLMLLTAWGACA